jgi:serine/threonine protein kinase
VVEPTGNAAVDKLGAVDPRETADDKEKAALVQAERLTAQPVIFSRGGVRVTPDDFELCALIGKGSFGKVMQVKKKDTGAIYAMKVLRKEAIIARKQVAHTMAERNILQKVQHPFIVTLHHAFQTEAKLYMVLDYVNGGELFFHLKNEGKFAEPRVRLYAAEISMALQYLHAMNVVYRDLKPENILLDAEGHIRITDFGLSKELAPEELTHTFCGTPEYLAPEVLKGQGHGVAVDWWSLGTLVYEMLTGLPPFYSQNINIMYQKILNGELRYPAYVSAEAVALLDGLLTRDPERRLGTRTCGADLRAAPFFRGLDWDKLYARQITPPFRPKVKNAADVSQIDPVFTQEQAVDSLVVSNLSALASNGEFGGFTFNPGTVLSSN